MKQSQKGRKWYFGMKAYIDVDAESGLVDKVHRTGGSVNDVAEANALLHGEETSTSLSTWRRQYVNKNAKQTANSYIKSCPCRLLGCNITCKRPFVY